MIADTIRAATINPRSSGDDGQRVPQKGLSARCWTPLPLPAQPDHRTAFARDHDNDGAEMPLVCDPDAPLSPWRQDRR